MKLLYPLIILLLSCSTEPETIKDCAGIENGTATVDDCGLCTGGTTDNVANYLKDCAGECGGDAIEDCAGECEGDAILDFCDVCNGDGTSCVPTHGCLDSQACNYNPDVVIDNNSCEYMDNCEVCDNDPDNDCTQDE